MAVGVTASYKNSNAKQDATLVEADATTTTFTGPGVAVVPVSATGKHTMFVVVSNLTGAGATVACQLQHSVDGTNWANVGSADANRTANGTYAYTVTGPVARNVRVSVGKSGTYTTGTVSVFDYISAS
jgi:hypothetical protein